MHNSPPDLDRGTRSVHLLSSKMGMDRRPRPSPLSVERDESACSSASPEDDDINDFGWYVGGEGIEGCSALDDSDGEEGHEVSWGGVPLANPGVATASARSLSPAFQLIQFWQEKEDAEESARRQPLRVPHSCKNFLSCFERGVDEDSAKSSFSSAFPQQFQRLKLSYSLSTKSFLAKVKESGQRNLRTQYTIGVSSIRVVKTPNSLSGKHAEYQVVLSSDRGLWVAWRRFTHFKLLQRSAVQVLSSGSQESKSHKVWQQLTSRQKVHRCLEAEYLLHKRRLLEIYLSQLLFELASPDILREFVSDGWVDNKDHQQCGESPMGLDNGALYTAQSLTSLPSIYSESVQTLRDSGEA
jgi:hypothetical protein